MDTKTRRDRAARLGAWPCLLRLLSCVGTAVLLIALAGHLSLLTR